MIPFDVLSGKQNRIHGANARSHSGIAQVDARISLFNVCRGAACTTGKL